MPLKSVLYPHLEGRASPAFTPWVLPLPLCSPQGWMGWGNCSGHAKQQGSGVGLACTGWATLWAAAGKPSLDCAHLFGLAEVGNVQGVDATGAYARPVHLSTVLELLLLPR